MEEMGWVLLNNPNNLYHKNTKKDILLFELILIFIAVSKLAAADMIE